MRKLDFKNQPFHWLLILSGVTVVGSFLGLHNYVDVHLHDTYVVISMVYVFWMVAIITALLWIFYMLMHRYLLSRMLTWLHIVMTTLGVVAFLITAFFSIDNNSFLPGYPRRYYDYGSWNSIGPLKNSIIISGIIVLIFLAGQLAFIINILLGIASHLSNQIRTWSR